MSFSVQMLMDFSQNFFSIFISIRAQIAEVCFPPMHFPLLNSSLFDYFGPGI